MLTLVLNAGRLVSLADNFEDILDSVSEKRDTHGSDIPD